MHACRYVGEWMSNYIPWKIVDVITDPCSNFSRYLLEKGLQCSIYGTCDITVTRTFSSCDCNIDLQHSMNSHTSRVTIWDVWRSRRITLETHNRSPSPTGIKSWRCFQIPTHRRTAFDSRKANVIFIGGHSDRDIDSLSDHNLIKKVDATNNNNTGNDYMNTVLPQKYHIDSMLTHILTSNEWETMELCHIWCLPNGS